MNPWQGTTETILKTLETGSAGLKNFEAEKRLFKYGLNSIKRRAPIPIITIFFDQLVDLLVLLLIIAGVLSFILGDSRSGTIIMIIVLINTIIGFSQEYKAEKVIRALAKLLPQMVRVRRDGREKLIKSSHLFPGDIVILGQGDKVPADIRLLEAYDLLANEQALTGESAAVRKEVKEIKDASPIPSQIFNMLFMGTIVARGEASGVVVATGLKTEFGKIAEKSVAIRKTLSPLQEKIGKMAKRVAIIAAFVVIGLVIYKYFTDRNFISALTFSIAVAAALVPEGLPATISVALSLGARNLAKRRALVRNLVSVETLGSVTVICSDKTGTLTTGEMKVKELWQNPESKLSADELEKAIQNTLVLCNDAEIISENSPDNPTEIALLRFAKDSGAATEKIRKSGRKIAEIPFEAEKRYMRVTYQIGGKKINYLKGAPEVIIELTKIEGKEKKQIEEKFSAFADEGFRVLALAADGQFLALVAIFDPPREGIKEVIDDCQAGNIRLIMLTGDNPLTALSIAKMVGIADDDKVEVIDGKQIDQLSDVQLRGHLQREPIFARILPEHKFRIVDNLMKMGEIVAVTGDGVNDAPALKRADIGIAMGGKGTDVSREAADLVLLDDNFATIVHAIKEGRAIFDNIKKFLFYIFSSNFGELLTVVIGMIFGLPLPISAIQILCVDVGTDVLPSMALIFEPQEREIMKTKPRSKDVQLLTGKSFLHLSAIGLIMGGGAVLNFTYIMRLSGNYQAATTASLLTLVIVQVFNVFLSRCPNVSIFRYRFWRNHYLIAAEVFSLALILAMIYLPSMDRYLQTAILPSTLWLRALMFGVILLVLEEIYKYVRKNYK